jgi:hypothetical protein
MTQRHLVYLACLLSTRSFFILAPGRAKTLTRINWAIAIYNVRRGGVHRRGATHRRLQRVGTGRNEWIVAVDRQRDHGRIDSSSANRLWNRESASQATNPRCEGAEGGHHRILQR